MKKVTSTHLIYTILLCIVLLFNTGNILNIFHVDEKKAPESNNESQYISLDCELSFIELIKLTEEINVEVNNNYLNFVTNKLYCHNRIANSNFNFYQPYVDEKINIVSPLVGVGIVEDIENLNRAFAFNLLFAMFCLYHSKSKFLLKFPKYKLTNLLILLFSILILFGLNTSITFWATNLYIPLFVQTNLLNVIFYSTKRKVFFKSFISISCFGLVFFHSIISFYTSLAIVLISSNYINKQKVLSQSFFLLIPMIVSYFVNIKDYFFKRDQIYDYSILLKDGFFQNTIVNQNDGFKMYLLLINFLFIYIVILGFRNILKKESIELTEVYKSFISGFSVWAFLSITATISQIFNFFISKLFGFSTKPDIDFSFMWSGLNFGYEMTSFWFLTLLLMLSYLILREKKIVYFLLFILVTVFTILNGSRTALFLFILSIPFFLVFGENKQFTRKTVLIIFSSFVIFNLIFPQSFERFSYKLLNLDCNQVLSSQLKDTENRTDYDLKISTYNLTFEDVLKEKTSINNLNSQILKFSSCFLGRQVEWARFFIISEIDGVNKLFGYGYGNSYEKLVIEIEKPHSLVLSIYYQLGLFGVFFYLFILLRLLYKNLQSDEILETKIPKVVFCSLFLINAIKTSFLFTYWGIIFSLTLLVVSENSKKQVQ